MLQIAQKCLAEALQFTSVSDRPFNLRAVLLPVAATCSALVITINSKCVQCTCILPPRIFRLQLQPRICQALDVALLLAHATLLVLVQLQLLTPCAALPNCKHMGYVACMAYMIWPCNCLKALSGTLSHHDVPWEAKCPMPCTALMSTTHGQSRCPGRSPYVTLLTWL